MLLQADPVILNALREDISNEDISTNAVMPRKASGEVELIGKEDGVVAGLDVFARVFELLDEETETEFTVKMGKKSERDRRWGRSGEIYVFFCPGSGQL